MSSLMAPCVQKQHRKEPLAFGDQKEYRVSFGDQFRAGLCSLGPKP